MKMTLKLAPLYVLLEQTRWCIQKEKDDGDDDDDCNIKVCKMHKDTRRRFSCDSWSFVRMNRNQKIKGAFSSFPCPRIIVLMAAPYVCVCVCVLGAIAFV